MLIMTMMITVTMIMLHHCSPWPMTSLWRRVRVRSPKEVNEVWHYDCYIIANRAETVLIECMYLCAVPWPLTLCSQLQANNISWNVFISNVPIRCVSCTVQKTPQRNTFLTLQDVCAHTYIHTCLWEITKPTNWCLMSTQSWSCENNVHKLKNIVQWLTY